MSPEVSQVRTVLRKRLMDEPRIAASEKAPRPHAADAGRARLRRRSIRRRPPQTADATGSPTRRRPAEPYQAVLATPTPALDKLLVFRSVHPLYGAFLLDQLGIADRDERLQALESVLEMPRPLLRYVRVPRPDELPPGPLATTRLDAELIRRGLIARPRAEDRRTRKKTTNEEEERPPTLADKLRLLFDALHPERDRRSRRNRSGRPANCCGFDGNFNLYVRTRDLVKQEGIVFRHLLRLILLCGEFAQVTPPDTTPDEWQADLRDIGRSADGQLPGGRSGQHRRDDRAGPRRRRGGGRDGGAAAVETAPPKEEKPGFEAGIFD